MEWIGRELGRGRDRVTGEGEGEVTGMDRDPEL
jgi:hypothetical protein